MRQGLPGYFKRFQQHRRSADMVGQDQHQARIEGLALGRTEIAVMLDQGGVKAVGIIKVGLQIQSAHAASSAPYPSARRHAAAICAARGRRQRAQTY